MMAAAIAYKPSENSTAAVKPNSIASSAAREALITEPKPLMPEAHTMKSGVLFASRFSPIGNGRPIKNAMSLLLYTNAMKRLLYVPIVLSLIVLGAHFLRDANHLGVAVAVGLTGLLFVKRPAAARVVQVALVLGALEWVWTIYALVQVRTAMGMPATRMMVILGVVAAATALSAGLFQTKALKRIYRLD